MEPPPAYEEKPEDRATTSSQPACNIAAHLAVPPPRYNDALSAPTTMPVGAGPAVIPIYLEQPPPSPRVPRRRDDEFSAWKLIIVIGASLAFLIFIAVIGIWISFAMRR
ncbi:hypothetical protein PFISCL1PPCAC_21953 [Pristionchus fissidentatus]|uniref:Uncharacterized protein n=1 Tax=Pristionchus fissidentatus TaxID=1538716 RepID=A0AAV5WFF4_9BILA|nr:hypothetical protein PFISCL1PPCAC_21953 [Pristionchus fissidentatus]